MSSFVCWHLTVKPALRVMAGWPEPRLRRVKARLCTDIRLDPERPEYHRVTLQYSRCALHALCALCALCAERPVALWVCALTGTVWLRAGAEASLLLQLHAA